jgi:hypothetical protein
MRLKTDHTLRKALYGLYVALFKAKGTLRTLRELLGTLRGTLELLGSSLAA